jgi:hypothetical protein
MSGYLQLGPVSFEQFEVPGRIGFGGAQRLAVHRLPGGARVIDAMGADDAPIAWQGIFTGANAAERARLLDVLRIEGLPLPLAWDDFAYLVVIAAFEARYERSNWVPYRIACTVLADPAVVAGNIAASLAATVQGDLLAASAGTDTTAAQAALAAPGATTLGSTAYGSAVASVSAAQAQVAAGMASANANLLAAADPVSAATAAGSLAQLADAQGYLGRAAANLANATS